MGFYFTIPPLHTWVVVTLGGGAAMTAYTAWDVYRSRRGAVPLFQSAAVVRTEESARFPCTTLKGFDVVVRSFFLSVSTTEETPSAFRRFVNVFNNETNQASGSGILSRKTQNDGSAATRLFVREGLTSSSETGPGEVVAASRWPEGTEKYSALVLEPSKGATDGTDAAYGRNPLRWLADRATHQSLVRCNPRSVMLDMACEGDPRFLGAPYLRVMLAAFLLLPASATNLHAAVLGVGGGSLPMFLQEYFARVLHRMDLVDVESACFRAAVEEMGLKERLNGETAIAGGASGGGVHYHVQDGMHYLQDMVKEGQSTRNPAVDLLFVDLFVGSELDKHVISPNFLHLCRSSLSSVGVVAFNLPDRNKKFVEQCKGVFGKGNVFAIPVPASSNVVIVARNGQIMHAEVSHRHLYRRAQRLVEQYRLPYDLANHFPVWWRFW